MCNTLDLTPSTEKANKKPTPSQPKNHSPKLKIQNNKKENYEKNFH
jgi:hypothetical protein